jgi:hypothetical protein
LFVDTAAGRAQDFQLAKRNNAKDGRNGKHYVYLDVDELLTERSIFSMPNSPAIATSLLSFDKKGNVVTNNKRLRGYTGKFSALDHLILMRKDAPNAKPSHPHQTPLPQAIAINSRSDPDASKEPTIYE